MVTTLNQTPGSALSLWSPFKSLDDVIDHILRNYGPISVGGGCSVVGNQKWCLEVS